MHTPEVNAETARQRLIEGNLRFSRQQADHPHQSAERRAEVSAGQHPFAALLSCADSRLPPEILFDQGLGDLFVIRNAGNVVDDVVLGSLEYAVDHLSLALIVVLAHTNCGAVTAAVQGGPMPGHLSSIVEVIQPALESAQGQKDAAAVQRVGVAHMRNMVQRIQLSQPILAGAARQRQIQVVGGLYHLDSGLVEFLD